MFNKTSSPDQQPEQQNAAEIQPTPDAEAETAPTAETSAQAEAQDWQNKYLQLQDQFTRLAADFENFRKRSRDEQDSLVKYSAQKSIMELLPVLDNLDRATSSLSENSEPQVLYKSFGLMQKQLLDGLEAMGLRKVKAIGEPFDPQFHEAVNRMPSADVPENVNMYEAQSGYQLHDKVIRPALVVVSTGSPDGAAAEPQAEEADKRANPFIK